MASLPGQVVVDEGLEEMWIESSESIATIDPAAENWKIQTLPLARIKKIMKSEEFILQELEKEKQEKLAAEEAQSGLAESEKPSVKFMISGEAPVLMSKACELLIKDLSFRAWRHTERNRRRTLQRQDLHAAVGESEVYDFLIDIVPRVTTAPKTHQAGPQAVPQQPADGSGAGAMASTTIPPGLHIPNAGLIAGLSSTMGQGGIPPSGGLDSTNMLHHMQTQQQHYQTSQLQYQQQHPQHDQMMQQQNAQAASQAQQPQVPQQMLHQQHTTYVTIPQGTALGTVTGVPTYLPPSSTAGAAATTTTTTSATQHTSGPSTTATQWAPVPQAIDGGHGRGGATS